MKRTTWEETLATIAAYKKQFTNEEAIRNTMNAILEKGGYDEADLPQNDDLLAAVQRLVSTNPRVYTALDALGVDYIEIDRFKCFKADSDSTGSEGLFFISPELTLTLTDSYL